MSDYTDSFHSMASPYQQTSCLLLCVGVTECAVELRLCQVAWADPSLAVLITILTLQQHLKVMLYRQYILYHKLLLVIILSLSILTICRTKVRAVLAPTYYNTQCVIHVLFICNTIARAEGARLIENGGFTHAPSYTSEQNIIIYILEKCLYNVHAYCSIIYGCFRKINARNTNSLFYLDIWK